MKIVAGLGNPGKRYEGTLHNAGFHVVERLASGAEMQRSGVIQEAAFAFVRLRPAGGGEAVEVLLLKPLTYMNRCGAAVAPVARHQGVAPGDLLVVVDDMDLPPGAIRLRGQGSSGGHRGLESIEEELGTADFPRLRIGIGRPPEGVEPQEYVLSVPPGVEFAALLDGAVERATAGARAWVLEGLERAMNRFNRREECADGKGETS